MKKKVISVTTVSFERIAFEKGIAVSYWNDPTGVSHRLKCYQPYHFCRLFDVLFPDRNKQLEYIRFTPESLSEFIRFLHFTLREVSKNTKIEAQLLEVVHSGISYPELYPLSENIGLFSIRAKHSDLLEYLENGDIDRAANTGRVTRAPIGAEVAEEDALPPDFQSSGTKSKSSGTKWTLDRPSNITTLADGRFRISIKHKKYNSKKNETLEMFKERIFLLTNVKV